MAEKAGHSGFLPERESFGAQRTKNSAGNAVIRSAVVGELVSTKFAKLKILVLLLVAGVAVLAGCGSGSSSNVVTVSVSPSVNTVIVTQSVTITATVSGSTNTNVTWACTYITRSFDSKGTETDGKSQSCSADSGNIPANSTNATVVFSAPPSVPDPTKISGTNCTGSQASCLLAISITATAAADTKRTAVATVSVISGIAVQLTPLTATVPTSNSSCQVAISSAGCSQFQFAASIQNDISSRGVTWLVTQGTPTVTTNGTVVNFPELATCAPGCGSVDQHGLYTAPSALPTTVTLTIVVSSTADISQFAIGTITIVQGQPITFNGISPTIAPQNAVFYDIYLDAPNVTSASTVTLQGDQGTTKLFNFAGGQLKVLFPIPTATVTAPTSTGVRLRLLESDLASADGFTVSVADPAQPVKSGAGPFRFTVVPVRATSVASQPDSLVQDTGAGGELGLTVNGGYFGPGGGSVVTTFLGTSLSSDSTAPPSTARQLNRVLTTALAGSNPGLYQLSVANNTSQPPVPNNPSITNLAIFPDYQNQTNVPVVLGTFSNGLGGALTNASAIAVDPQLGVAAVAVTGGNRVEFFKITAGALTPIGTTATVNVPTSLSINTTLHTVAVVSYQDQQVSVFPVPSSVTSGAIAPTTTISLSGLIPAEATPLPIPYSIGVDSDTNMAVVAYSSTANPTTAKVGFLLDLNTDTQKCLNTTQTPPCVFAQVTLNTGQYPQITALPHSHLAIVTPGGLGIVSGIDVTKASASTPIANVSLTSGLVTVTTTVAHNLNPGNPGTVLILNVPKGTTNQTDFNGAFTVQSVLNATSFTYALTSTVNDTASGGTAAYSPANISIGGIAQTSQGVAVNPITGLVAIADPNATGLNGPQINLLNSLDQNITSIGFRATCTFYTTTCSGAAELLGTNSVAFQPFSNSLVSYNAAQNILSISDPVTAQRYACSNCSPASFPLAGTGTFTLAGSNLALAGGLAVDPATNQALVVQSGSSDIVLVDLGHTSSTKLKAVQITEVLVPSADGISIGGIPAASFPQGTLTSTTALANVKVFGSGFASGAVVRLDGTAISTPAPVSDREIDVTIPASFLSAPHRYALDVVSGGVQSNASDFIVVQAVDFSKICQDSSNNFVNTKPSSVAIADQLKLAGYAPIAVVSNNGCNSVSVVDIAPTLPTFDSTGHLTGFAPNPTFGTILHTIAVGTGPQGVAVSPRFGLAVVANNGGGTASIVDLIANNLKVADVTTGSSPIGVAINEGTGAALVANTGTNTVSEINLGLLSPPVTTPPTTPPTTLTATTIGVDTEPIAIAIDPDRGTNNNGLAVVTALALNSSTFPRGVLDSVDIGASTPAKSTTAQVGSVTLTPTGVVFDPSVNPALFYAVSSGGNVVSSFNPDNGAATTVHVGINPTSLAINPQTGGILTVNTISNTISIIDTLSSPFRTQRSYGIPGSPQLGVAIDQFLNMAVIVDQANNRVLLFPMPN